jgi:glycosyltransferase involved in cell wall biosynthesis
MFHNGLDIKTIRNHQLPNGLAIVTPVLNDWVSFSCLLAGIAKLHGDSGPRFHVLAVDDGSSTPLRLEDLPERVAEAVHSIEVLHLAVNLGHQRAIAVGLSAIAKRDDIATVIIMDCDGEDRPEDIAPLLAASACHPDKAILARRTQRQESSGFRLGYRLYKVIFSLLTGQTIDFGNFTVLPIAAVRRLACMPDLWNNLPAAIIRSKLGTVMLPLPRGRRFAGQSRMNLSALIVHGLSAMSVFSEIIFVRVLLGTLFVSGLTIALMLGVVAMRFLTDLAIPGWTSTVFGDLVILLVQALVMIVATTFVVLSSRSHRPMIPLVDASSFVVDRELVYPTVSLSVKTRP